MAQQWTRSRAAMGALTVGAFLITGCPGGKDKQQLRPLSELREPPQPGELTERGTHGEAASSTPGADAETPAEADSDYTVGDTAYSAGTDGWRIPSTGHLTGNEMTFGSGTSAQAPDGPWAINTDSTGGVGDALGIGTTYGASRGTLAVMPGTPRTRAEPKPAR